MTTRALVFVVALLCLAQTVEAREKWGPFRGQLVDSETGQPIAGAAIIVVWYEAVYAIVQTNQRFYDAVETVTGPDGRFEMPRRSPAFFGFRIFDPQVIYFAPGYIAEREVVTPPHGEPFVAPTVVQMRRVKTREELKNKYFGRPADVPLNKMKGLTRAINVERQLLGFAPLPVEGEGQ